MLPTPVDDSQGGVDLLFSSPVQSPARLLRELHADPDIQAQLEAERERDRAYERTRLAARSRMSRVLTSSLRLLSSNDRVNACVLSVARFVAVVMGVLLVTVPTLLLLLESDIDVSFLHEIRQTPEFEQFHYEYYCPLRRWILCKISMAMENLWSDWEGKRHSVKEQREEALWGKQIRPSVCLNMWFNLIFNLVFSENTSLPKRWNETVVYATLHWLTKFLLDVSFKKSITFLSGSLKWGKNTGTRAFVSPLWLRNLLLGR